MMNFIFRLPFRWPHTVMLAVVATWFLFGVVLPFSTVRSHSEGYGVFVMVLYVAGFVAGSVVTKLTTRRAAAEETPPIASKIDLRLLLAIVIVIAATGVLLRVYDFVSVRGFALSLASGQENRLADLATLYSVGATDVSTLSLIAAPLAAFSIFPTLICFLMKAPTPVEKVLSYGLFAFPAFESAFFRGGALGLFFSVIFLFCIFGYRKKGAPLRLRTKAVFVGLGVLVFVVGGWMFVERVTAIFGTHAAYLSASAAGEVVVPSNLTLTMAELPGLGAPATMLYWITSYVGQGFHEFIYLVEHYSAATHTNGNLQGSLVLKALNVLLSTPYDPLAWLANPRAGKYQTMFGDVFIDFGVVWGFLQCLAMGWLFSLAHLSRVQGRRTGQFLDPVLKTFIIMGIAVSSFSGGLAYYLFAALAVVLLAHTVASRRRRAPAFALAAVSAQREASR